MPREPQAAGKYASAGHPPLLHWTACDQQLHRVGDNGLLFGVATECEYPVQQLAICAGDRLLLNTDGLTEPENANGEAFGDRQLERVLRGTRWMQPSEETRELLRALQAWQTRGAEQQDDITLVVIDAV